jgi:hypothetical protein
MSEPADTYARLASAASPCQVLAAAPAPEHALKASAPSAINEIRINRFVFKVITSPH